MNVWRAIGQGLDLTRRLWVAVFSFLLVYSAIGSLATVFLPFEVVNGQVKVPVPADSTEAMGRLVVALGIYLAMMACSLWLLGGVLAGTKELLEKRPFPPGELFRTGAARLWTMMGWAAAYTVCCLGAGVVVAFALGFVAAVTGQAAAMKSLAGLGFTAASMAVGLMLLFSPAAIVEKGAGVWGGFGESFRFMKQRGGGAALLVLGISVAGALIWWFGVLVLARASGAIRAALGIQPFAGGLPVFFFGLINGLPQAILSVFIPASLYTYYRGSSE